MKCLLLGPKTVESISNHKIMGYSVESERVNTNIALPHLSLFHFFSIKLKNRLSPMKIR